jgi:hypothetical protein
MPIVGLFCTLYPEIIQMFLFNDPAEFSELEQIEDRANPPASSVGLPLAMAVVIGGAGFAFTASAVVGGALAALPGYAIYKKLTRKMKNDIFLRRNPGCMAHLIKSDRDMIAWIEAHGKDDVAQQLQLAMKQGQKLTRAAKQTLKALVPKEALPAKKVTQFLAEVDRAAATQTRSVQESIAAVAHQKPAQGTTVESTAAKSSLVKTDIASHFLSDLRCTFLCAPPRTGKGVAAVGMMAGFKTLYPKGWLGSCTIKQFEGEDWYWQFSDRHINPSLESGAVPHQSARAIYHIYKEWLTVPSSKDAPALLVIDELRDTLKRLKGVLMEHVDADYHNPEKGFDDWLREELISSATLNQCHHRFVLLIAPVNTATALTFKDANSLQSYAAYVLVTPKELAFAGTKGNCFGAPAIAANDPRFDDWYGLAWSTKGTCWVGLPKIAADRIAELEGKGKQPAYAVVKEAVTIEPTDIAPPLPDSWEAIGRAMVATAFTQTTETPGKINADGTKEPIDPMLVLIDGYPDPEMRGALHLAYKWAEGRKSKGKAVDWATFKNRAKNDAKCTYLRENLEEIWAELINLI